MSQLEQAITKLRTAVHQLPISETEKLFLIQSATNAPFILAETQEKRDAQTMKTVQTALSIAKRLSAQQ
jgi:nucleoid-associated protein YgaU